MPEYIDRGLLRKVLRGAWTDPNCPEDIADYIMHVIDLLPVEKATNEPAVDPIRAAGGCYCRECVNYYEYDDWDRCHQETYTAHECSVFNRDLGPDGFCSRGELKKEVEE